MNFIVRTFQVLIAFIFCVSYAQQNQWPVKQKGPFFAIETSKPDFVHFEGDENQQCAIGKLNILEDGVLKKDCGEEIMDWFKE